MDVMQDFTLVEEAEMPSRTMGTILCCLCGVSIAPNPANMCVTCLRTQVDITEGITKQAILHNCRGCGRYLRPPWVDCELESKELLAICLKKINGLNKVKLVDAGFIWTEPHSRRIKVKLTIQKDVLNGVKLQQVFPVEFIVQNQQCDACQRSYTEHTWKAQVQVRQKVNHKKTFYWLEQLIIKHNAHEKCIDIEQKTNGIDFSFGDRSHALRFIDFLNSVVPIRSKAAKQLVSENIHTSDKNYKFTYSVEIVPICKDDLVILPSRMAATCGNINPLCLINRVTSLCTLLDPRSLQIAEFNADKYWRDPFRAVLSSDSLEEFIILDVTPVTVAPMGSAALRRKYRGDLSRLGSGASVAGSVAPSSAASVRTARSTRSGRGGMEPVEPVSASEILSKDVSEAVGQLANLTAVGLPGAGTKRRYANFSAQTPQLLGASEKMSIAGDLSTVGGKSTSKRSIMSGGFTGSVSLAGGGVRFSGASTVATTVTGGRGGKLLLCDAEVVRARDFGNSDEKFIVRTHLGNLLRPGDRVLGYDLRSLNFDEEVAEFTMLGSRGKDKPAQGRVRNFELPDIVLVRKVFRRDKDREEEKDLEIEASINRAHAILRASDEQGNNSTPTTPGDSDSSAAASKSARRKMREERRKLREALIAEATATTTPAVEPNAVRPKKAKERIWKLKRFDDFMSVKHSDAGGSKKGTRGQTDDDFESFLRDLENDPMMRANLNLYVDKAALQRKEAKKVQRELLKKQLQEGVKVETPLSDSDSDDDGVIGLEELLDDMALGTESNAIKSAFANTINPLTTGVLNTVIEEEDEGEVDEDEDL